MARLLNVSPQAISRWECGSTTPDISLLPSIAALFRISIEELLGVEYSKQQQVIQNTLSQIKSLLNRKALNDEIVGDAIEITRTAVKKNPYNFQLKNALMYTLFVSTDETTSIKKAKNNLHKYSNEIITLGEQILADCTSI